MKSTPTIALLLCASLLLPLLSLVPQASASANTQVTAPPVIDTGLGPGIALNLTIQVLNIGPLPEDLDAWEVHVKLDPSILQITRLIDGPVLDDVVADFGGSTLDTMRFNPAVGTVDASELLVRGTPQPVDGGFVSSSYPSDTALLYVEVTVLSFGVSNINFTNLVNPSDPPTKLRDVDGRDTDNIDHQAVNGVFANVPYNQLPIASFTYSPTIVTAGNPVTFDGSASYDPDNDTGPARGIQQYTWDFGDGNVAVAGAILTHTYVAPAGPLTVTLNVTDFSGLVGTFQKTRFFVVPINQLPVARFDYTPKNPKTFEPVTFDASASSDPEGFATGTTVPFTWDFGDGQTTGGKIVVHTYRLVGNYTVSLTVIDDAGQKGETSQVITVGLGTPPIQSAQAPWILPSAIGAAAAVAAVGVFAWRRRQKREGEAGASESEG